MALLFSRSHAPLRFCALLLRVTLLVCGLTAGCHGCDDGGSARDVPGDAGADGGERDGGRAVEPIPGTRPVLSSPGQSVPLLWGRVVELRDEQAGVTASFALDDPTQPLYQRFFQSLNGACAASFAMAVAPSGPGVVLPGCGQDGAYQTQLHLCRAAAGAAFLAGDGAGLTQEQGQPRLNLPERASGGEPLWSALSTASEVRASWGLFVVAELREVLAAASMALDPASCQALDDGAAVQIAADLRAASEQLSPRTESAGALLAQALTAHHQGAPDDADTRIRVTRALNHSLLEQQKLYAPMPYALFSPLEPEQEAMGSDRYPVLFASPSEAAARAATLLALTSTRYSDGEGALLTDDALGLSFVAAVRAHEPLLFGHLTVTDVAGTLARLDLTPGDLQAGARLVLEGQRVAGTPVMHVASTEVPGGLSVERPSALATTGYVHATTGARATAIDENLGSYARRGLHHALAAAQMAAVRALTRSALPGEAQADLTVLSTGPTAGLGSLEVCARSGGAANTTLMLLLSEAARPERYELWSGELGVACALDASCDTTPYRIASLAQDATRYIVSDSAASSASYLTVRDLDATSHEGRKIVAVVSTRPLDAVDGERCFFEPLSDAMHERMRALHDRAPLPTVPRTVAPWQQGTQLVQAPSDAVSVLFGRTLSGLDADGNDLQIELGEPFASSHLAWASEVRTACPSDASIWPTSQLRECGAAGLARAAAHDCLASWARAERDGRTPAESLTLRLLAWHEAHRAMVAAADALDGRRCPPAGLDDTAAQAALEMLARLVAETQADLPGLSVALEVEADTLRASDRDEVLRRVARTRGLVASRLASARLLLSAPRSAYEPEPADAQAADPFDHALTRFPVVTRDAVLAEDERAEALLRQSELQPWLADLTVHGGTFDAAAIDAALSGTALVLRLGTRLAELVPDTYSDLPREASAVLAALGISARQLEDAAVRVTQTAEARGLSLLPIAGSAPLRASGLGDTFPAPVAVQLSALSEGKASAATDALPAHFALRGHYHTLAHVAEALRHAPPSALGQALEALQATLAAEVQDSIAIEQSGPVLEAGSLTLELTVDGSVNDADAVARTQLVFSDSGLACILTGSVGGRACEPSEYLFVTDDVAVRTLSGLPGTRRRVRLSGYRFPSVTSSMPDQALELTQGRVYVVEQSGSTLHALAGATLSDLDALPVRHALPRSEALELALLELLAFRVPGEGCAACRPSSVCETTRCERELCIREAVGDGKVCGSAAVCNAGACTAVGCGDGSRADGTDEVAYEACDDGNLNDGDGCSALCLPELRALEPTLKEGWPAGPASAVASDGLGQQLLVYTADALAGDNQLIRAAVLDAFGVQSGSERTLDASIPRAFVAEPCVTGLRDGGFAVVYASPDIAGEAGLGLRIVSSGGAVGALVRVDSGNATAGSPRLASVEDGFVVVWSERGGSGLVSRVRARRFDAEGTALDVAFDVAGASLLVDQVEPSVASSLGQIMIAWTERDADDGTPLLVRGRRFFPYGSPVDADAFEIAGAGGSQSALAVLGSDDYLVAWTSRSEDPQGDILRRKLRRFGLPLSAGESEAWVSGPQSQSTPVIAGLGADAVLAYQSGSPLPITALVADAGDSSAASSLSAALATAREQDVSAVATPRGVWFVWSERQAQQRALYAYLLPVSVGP